VSGGLDETRVTERFVKDSLATDLPVRESTGSSGIPSIWKKI